MSINIINNLEFEKFETEVMRELASPGNKLTPWVKHFDLMGNVSTQIPKMDTLGTEGLFPGTMLNPEDQNVDKFVLTVAPFAASTKIYHFIQTTVGFNVRTQAVMNVVGAVERKRDQIILDELERYRLTAPGGVFPNRIAITRGELNVDDLSKIAEILDDNEVPQEGRAAVITNRAYHSLLRQENVSSSDFNVNKTLPKGNMGSYYGFEFVPFSKSNGKETGMYTTTPSSNIYTMYFMHKDAIAYGKNDSKMLKIDYLPKEVAHLIMCSRSEGALVVRPESIVQVDFTQI